MAYGSVAKIQIQIDLKVQSFFFFLSSTPHSTPFEYQYALWAFKGKWEKVDLFQTYLT